MLVDLQWSIICLLWFSKFILHAISFSLTRHITFLFHSTSPHDVENKIEISWIIRWTLTFIGMVTIEPSSIIFTHGSGKHGVWSISQCLSNYVYDLKRNVIYNYLCHVDIDHDYDTSYFQIGQLILDNELLLNYFNIDIRNRDIHGITIVITKLDRSKTIFTTSTRWTITTILCWIYLLSFWQLSGDFDWRWWSVHVRTLKNNKWMNTDELSACSSRHVVTRIPIAKEEKNFINRMLISYDR